VAQGLVVYRLDCLDSALVVQEQLLAEVRATGARVYSLQPDDAAELRRIPADPSRQGVRDVLRAAAANQPQMAALRSRRRRQSRPGAGSPPYGYCIADGSLVPDPAEQAALVRIAELRASGATLREIARELDYTGHKPKRGQRWHPESVRRIVERLEPK
jgi:DNA invertase Pin-like site-specific DNA recombinase